MEWGAFGQTETLSKTTKLILLDSLLQEVCIESGLAGRSPLSSLRLSVCLVQSQSALCRTKDSPLIYQYQYDGGLLLIFLSKIPILIVNTRLTSDLILCLRPYHVENTSSRLITEVKQH